MYAYIKGKLIKHAPTSVFVETGGVGYLINVSVNTYSQIEHLSDVKLYTHLHVKEDDLSLYGFFDLEEKNLFTHLISVSGIGPNTARIVLSSMSPEEVTTAIITENDAAFKKVKGVGPKTAKRIILDLKDKLAKSPLASVSRTPGVGQNREEAKLALLGLGFSKAQVQKVLDKIPEDSSQSVEHIVKSALQLFS